MVPVQNMYAYREVEDPPIGNDEIDANHFELKPGLLNMAEANAFAGKANEDPNKHLTKFIQISNTVKLNGVRDEQIRLRLFPFSLRDDARDWYDSMGSGSVKTWDAMVDLFLEKYFPPSEVLKRQAEIIQFQMKPHETIREAWARFKTLLKRCPKHGLSPGHQVITFYRGCTPDAMRELNWSAGGALLQLGENDVMQVIERVASTDEGWNNERNKSYRVSSATEDDRIDRMSKQLDLLTTQLGIMEMRQSGPEIQGGVEGVNYVHQGGNNMNFNNYRPNQGGGNYNHYGNKVHPNLSYGNPNNALQPPPGFTVANGMVDEQKKPTTEDILAAFMNQTTKYMEKTDKYMESTSQRLGKVENDVQSLNVHMKSIDTQISKISQAIGVQHQPGQFPAQTINNPKDCKAIHLRCGKSYEGPSMPIEEKKSTPEEDVRAEENSKGKNKVDIQTKKDAMPEKLPPPSIPTTVRVPFPFAVKEKKLDEQFSKFLDIFRKVHINIPLVEALQEMPTYAKFLKDVLSKKKKWIDYETVNISENCSAIIQKKLPAKLKDLGSFNISCVIGNDRQTKALCDLGASINLMPLSFFRKMKIGTLKPTTITLQMADRSVTYPKGIVEDVLVKVHDFIFPVDFVVLDMEEDMNVPLILGRPFLATGKALIDIAKGELTLRMGNKRHILSIYNAMKSREDEELVMKMECKAVHVVEVQKTQAIESTLGDFSLPRWMFGSCGGSISKEETASNPKVKEKKTKAANSPKVETKICDGALKTTWWKKRLARSYASKIDRKSNTTIYGVT
ncbi:uncharacterized protein LOC125199726 [Salvia hispanica]|uniref:uncharacterized protein LOC125199726 n=1 Tax=Salvia hispanica TaxID=49212 RepID=UPI002008FDE8|nr:uncharacterized protein LOC125199726 [Salvia hispanica]